MKFKKSLIQVNIAVLLSMGANHAFAACVATGTSLLDCSEVTISNNRDYGIPNFDKIKISTTTVATTNGLKGWAIYSAGNDITAKDVVIITSGSKSDGIVTKNGTNTVTIDKLKITTTGSSADGINLGKESNGYIITIGDNAEIDAYGMGVRANTSATGNRENLIILGKNAVISSRENGSNIDFGSWGEFGTGYAVYAGNTNSEATGKARVVIGDNSAIRSSGNSAHAVYANKGGVIQLGSTDIQATGTRSHGIYAENGFVSGGSAGSQVYLLSDTKITTARDGTKFAIYSQGVDSLVSSYDKSNDVESSGVFIINGDLKAETNGTIDLRMNAGSQFTGKTVATNATLNLNIKGINSKWLMTESSNLTTLDVTDAKVYLGDQTNPINTSNQLTLTMENLKGNNGEFFVRTDIVSSDNTSLVNVSDKIIVTGTSSGNHKIFVNDQSTGSAVGDEIVRVAEVADGGAKFTLSNVNGYVDMGAYRYGLAEVDPLTRSTDKHWYLMAGVTPPVEPPVNPPVTPPLTETADHSINILNINYLLSNIENQTLLQRMGELRQSEGSEGDVWTRVFTGKLDSFADNVAQGFDLDYTGIQIGADKLFIREKGHLYLGGMIGTTKADANYDIGDGDTKSYHAGMYLTYRGNNGFYIDGIAKYVHMKNNFTAQTGGGYKVKGGGNTSGYSVGIEAGKRFYFDQPQTGWYIEPQAQLTYSHQDSATVEASNGLKTDLDGFDSTIGRVSAIIGYTLVEGNNPIDVYLKTGYMKEFDGKAGYTFNQSKTTYARYKLNGDWWDNGMGVNTQINKNHNLYMDLNYSVGNKFDKVQLNAGYRYSF